MAEVDKKLEIQRLLNALDPDRLSKEDFVNSFEQVVNLILKNEEQMAQAITRLEETYQNLTSKNREDYVSGLTDLKGQVNELFVGDQLKRMDGDMKSHVAEMKKMMSEMIDKKMGEVDERMAKVKDGYSPVKGRDYSDGLPGKDIDSTILEGLKKEMESIKDRLSNLPRGRAMGRAKTQIIRAVDLTASVDGVTTAFTLPPDTVAVLGVWSSQFPISFRQNVDWTFSGRTLTLETSQVGTPASGQTLWALCDVLFYP